MSKHSLISAGFLEIFDFHELLRDAEMKCRAEYGAEFMDSTDKDITKDRHSLLLYTILNRISESKANKVFIFISLFNFAANRHTEEVIQAELQKHIRFISCAMTKDEFLAAAAVDGSEAETITKLFRSSKKNLSRMRKSLYMKNIRLSAEEVSKIWLKW